MQLYPAIDMKGGKCVRLTQGQFDNVKVYSHRPADMAKLWVDQGATWLHLVDLDGALAGRSVNEEAIREILKEVSVPVQLGGGIRSREAVRNLLDLGVTRCIIGTRAVEEPEFIRSLVEEFGPERIVVGVDARDGLVAVNGWEQVSSVPAVDLCRRMKSFGVRHIVYTDISRDGMLAGPNVAGTRRLAEETGLDMIASGGVSSMEDLEALKEQGIQGAIVGKALYEQRIALPEAVRRFQRLEAVCSWEELKKDPQGLVPVIVQDYYNRQVLMMAYMNEQAYRDTLKTGRMHYYSRSRGSQWLKGETSGHFQYVKELWLDCDSDTLLAQVEQMGVACHTGARSCFFRKGVR